MDKSQTQQLEINGQLTNWVTINKELKAGRRKEIKLKEEMSWIKSPGKQSFKHGYHPMSKNTGQDESLKVFVLETEEVFEWQKYFWKAKTLMIPLDWIQTIFAIIHATQISVLIVCTCIIYVHMCVCTFYLSVCMTVSLYCMCVCVCVLPMCVCVCMCVIYVCVCVSYGCKCARECSCCNQLLLS